MAKFLLIMAIMYSVSWIATCGVIKLIALCFGLPFSWLFATGVWLILCLVKATTANH